MKGRGGGKSMNRTRIIKIENVLHNNNLLPSNTENNQVILNSTVSEHVPQ